MARAFAVFRTFGWENEPMQCEDPEYREFFQVILLPLVYLTILASVGLILYICTSVWRTQKERCMWTANHHLTNLHHHLTELHHQQKLSTTLLPKALLLILTASLFTDILISLCAYKFT